MSTLSTSHRVMLAAGALVALGLGAGCGPSEPVAGPGPQTSADPTASPEPTDEPTPPPGDGEGDGNQGGGNQGGGGGNPPSTPKPPAQSDWPSPEDCISYNPNNVTVTYDNGTYTVSDGSTVVMRLVGQDGDGTGDKALALAKKYRKHCYVGRANTRTEERGAYVFDYWRSPSGNNTPVPGQEDDCRDYNRHNLTIDDMGGGYGWRVRDHDNVLHVFDNNSDARKGKLVLQKYGHICEIGNNDENDRTYISYLF
jgi:hypothetical protein